MFIFLPGDRESFLESLESILSYSSKYYFDKWPRIWSSISSDCKDFWDSEAKENEVQEETESSFLLVFFSFEFCELF